MLRPLGKKGDLTDGLYIIIFLFILAIGLIVGLIVNDKLKTAIETTALNDTVAAGNIIEAFDNVNTNTVQRGFVLVFGLLMVAVILSSFLIRVHPVFIFLYIIFLIIDLFVAVYIGNAYNTFRTNTEIAKIAANQTMINFILEHIVEISLAVGVLSIMIVFAKIFSQRGSRGGPGI